MGWTIISFHVMSQFGAVLGIVSVAIALQLLCWSALNQTRTPVERGVAFGAATLLTWGLFATSILMNNEPNCCNTPLSGSEPK